MVECAFSKPGEYTACLADIATVIKCARVCTWHRLYRVLAVLADQVVQVDQHLVSVRNVSIQIIQIFRTWWGEDKQILSS